MLWNFLNSSDRSKYFRFSSSPDAKALLPSLVIRYFPLEGVSISPALSKYVLAHATRLSNLLCFPLGSISPRSSSEMCISEASICLTSFAVCNSPSSIARKNPQKIQRILERLLSIPPTFYYVCALPVYFKYITNPPNIQPLLISFDSNSKQCTGIYPAQLVGGQRLPSPRASAQLRPMHKPPESARLPQAVPPPACGW